MAVEISILSGSRRGERIVLDTREFRAGDTIGCEVCFDPQHDPTAEGRGVVLRLASDGWLIESTGDGEILLNHTPIAQATRIRSGDLVRLSESGPDFAIDFACRRKAFREAVSLLIP